MPGGIEVWRAREGGHLGALVVTLEGEDEELMEVTGSRDGEEVADSEMFRGWNQQAWPTSCV